jgi:hypothetical protein
VSSLRFGVAWISSAMTWILGGVKGQSGSSEGYAAVLSFKVPIRFVESKATGETPATV